MGRNEIAPPQNPANCLRVSLVVILCSTRTHTHTHTHNLRANYRRHSKCNARSRACTRTPAQICTQTHTHAPTRARSRARVPFAVSKLGGTAQHTNLVGLHRQNALIPPPDHLSDTDLQEGKHIQRCARNADTVYMTPSRDERRRRELVRPQNLLAPRSKGSSSRTAAAGPGTQRCPAGRGRNQTCSHPSSACRCSAPRPRGLSQAARRQSPAAARTPSSVSTPLLAAPCSALLDSPA